MCVLVSETTGMVGVIYINDGRLGSPMSDCSFEDP